MFNIETWFDGGHGYETNLIGDYIRCVVSFKVKDHKFVCDGISIPIIETNSKDRSDIWENLSSLSTIPYFYVEPMRDRIIPYHLRNRTFADVIHFK